MRGRDARLASRRSCIALVPFSTLHPRPSTIPVSTSSSTTTTHHLHRCGGRGCVWADGGHGVHTVLQEQCFKLYKRQGMCTCVITRLPYKQQQRADIRGLLALSQRKDQGSGGMARLSTGQLQCLKILVKEEAVGNRRLGFDLLLLLGGEDEVNDRVEEDTCSQWPRARVHTIVSVCTRRRQKAA